jgi:hypothetical protein
MVPSKKKKQTVGVPLATLLIEAWTPQVWLSFVEGY